MMSRADLHVNEGYNHFMRFHQRLKLTEPAKEAREKELLLKDENETDHSTDEENWFDSDTGDHETRWERTRWRKRYNESLGIKRPRPRYATCQQCGESFDLIENSFDNCTWHHDKLIPNMQQTLPYIRT